MNELAAQSAHGLNAVQINKQMSININLKKHKTEHVLEIAIRIGCIKSNLK